MNYVVFTELCCLYWAIKITKIRQVEFERQAKKLKHRQALWEFVYTPSEQWVCGAYIILLCNVTVFSSISSLAARFRPPYHPNPQAMMTQVCFIIIFAVILKCLAPCAEKCQCTYHWLFEFNFRHQISGDRLVMGSLDLLKDIFHP